MTIGTFVVIIIIAIVLTIIWEMATPERTEEAEEEHQYINTKFPISYSTNNATKEEIQKDTTQQDNLNNIYLNEINSKLNKQNETIEKIKFNVGCLTFVIVVPIILYISIKILSLMAGYNLLQNLTNSLNNTPQTTVYVTDEEGNIIDDEEYHGQSIRE